MVYDLGAGVESIRACRSCVVASGAAVVPIVSLDVAASAASDEALDDESNVKAAAEPTVRFVFAAIADALAR